MPPDFTLWLSLSHWWGRQLSGMCLWDRRKLIARRNRCILVVSPRLSLYLVYQMTAFYKQKEKNSYNNWYCDKRNWACWFQPGWGVWEWVIHSTKFDYFRLWRDFDTRSHEVVTRRSQTCEKQEFFERSWKAWSFLLNLKRKHFVSISLHVSWGW